MSTETENTDAETEFLMDLRKHCRLARGSRARPELAIPAAQWEMKINERLEELERVKGPELPFKKAQAA
jgi:hypothetical protein